MKTIEFDYPLNKALIAKYPLKNRLDSRLLVLNRAENTKKHHKFSDICQYLNPNDLLVINNTKVIASRIFAEKSTGGKVEILIENILDEHKAYIHARASKKLIPGTILYINKQPIIKILLKTKLNLYLVEKIHLDPWDKLLANFGNIPLPNYMERKANTIDATRYQTVFAKNLGAIAAPTAGLHFSKDLLAKFNVAELTLHVGSGTFKPVTTENIVQHDMHFELLQVPQDTIDKIKQTKLSGGRIVAVGTTVVRALETCGLMPFYGKTNLFIYPGYKFKVVDMIITNFHLPKSTLLMLVCAFATKQQVLEAYTEAQNMHYRLFSYGDAMLIV